MPEGLLHSKLVTRLLVRIGAFLEKHPLGEAGTGLGCVLAHNPELVHTPDIFFIARDRLLGGSFAGPFDGAPDLAVEVLSQDEPAGKLQGRICDYLAGGTKLVWVIDPTNRLVMATYPSGYTHAFAGQDEVLGVDVLPGFSFRPEALFSEPAQQPS